MRRPLLEAAAGLSAGLLVGTIAPGPAAGLALAITSVVLAIFFRRHRASLVLLAFGLGIVRGRSDDGTGPGDVLARLGPEAALVKIRGEVVSDAEPTRSGLEAMDLDVRSVSGRCITGRVRLLVKAGIPLPSPGDVVEALGVLRRARGARNPGDRSRNDARPTILVNGAGRIRVLATSAGSSPSRLLASLRRAAAARLRGALPPSESGIASGLLLGRRADVPPDAEESFRRSGTVHLLAVSGLHVGLVVGAVYLLLGLARVPSRLRIGAAAGLAVVYAGLAGFRPPVVRAALLALLGGGAVALRRRTSALDLLGATAFLVLILRPDHAARVDFQLSFTAVLGLILMTSRIGRVLFPRRDIENRFAAWQRGHPLRRLLRSHVHAVLPASFAAWIVTGPLVLHHFGVLAPAAIPGNLVLLPLLVPAVGAAALALAIGPAGPQVATALSLPLRALREAAGLLSELPGAAIETATVPLAAILPAYAILALLVLRPVWRPRHLAAAVALPLALVLFVLPRSLPERDRLTVLDVGHGAAILLERRDGGVLLYDAGSTTPAVGRRRIGPALRARRIRRIDVMVLSHSDSDHVSGAAHLLRRFTVERLVVPKAFTRSALGRSILDVARRRGTRIRLVAAGDRLGAFGEVLHPPRDSCLGDNDGSIVLRARVGPRRVLLSGDIEELGIEALLASGRDVRADGLLLPHHGGRNERLPALLAAVEPDVLIVSASGRSRQDHRRWGRPCHTTASRGAVTLVEDGANLVVIPFRPPVKSGPRPGR